MNGAREARPREVGADVNVPTLVERKINIYHNVAPGTNWTTEHLDKLIRGHTVWIILLGEIGLNGPLTCIRSR
jgi:hypothetical protein